ncbi:TetR family transcriptional regulator [Rhodopseudomonas palustris]|uniref:TetR/AcrR family transcriptional regulator n=1 Tax=Rhodopseudomonas palustris TaxID=1076 RepID=UPI000D1BD34B|nr:TetR/AcrR family transcriptional regulator [Rhodopseudomonas palustris]AVT75231.1 TetR family transcriptional regulator [Rhodopseudomonas palustris]
MSWRKEQGRAERGYHHGNLKEALLQAALGLIAEKGPGGFTFADAARMAGVSPAAPYRHFRDRDELLSNIAQRGFELFEQVLAKAWDDGRPDTVTAFMRVGRAYLAFARNEPAYYSAMFESGVPIDVNPMLLTASERAFNVIRAAAERLAALTPSGVTRPPALMMALHIWSMSHGIASLFGRGDGARRKLPMAAEDLLEAGVLIYLRGLGFSTESAAAAEKPAEPKRSGPWGPAA